MIRINLTIRWNFHIVIFYIFKIQVMDHKYKTLFRDININYVMTEIKMKSILKLVSLNYTNFFIMGNLETIKHVMGMM